MNRSEQISWRGAEEKMRQNPSRCDANETHENFWGRINGFKPGYPVKKVIERNVEKEKDFFFFYFKVSGGWLSKLVSASCGNWNSVSFPCWSSPGSFPVSCFGM